MKKWSEGKLSCCSFVGMIWLVCISHMACGASDDGKNPGEASAASVERFEITLKSLEISTRISIRDENEGVMWNEPEQIFRFSLQFDMVDTNRPVAIDLNPPVILGIWDATGQIVDMETSGVTGQRGYKEVGWALVNEEGHSIRKLTPSDLTFELVLDPNQSLPSSPLCMEGYIWGLYAEKVIEVDVPFEVTDEWIDAPEDLQFLVSPQTPPTPGPIQYEVIPGATHRSASLRPTAPLALWKYETRIHSNLGNTVFPLAVSWDCDVLTNDFFLIKTQLVEDSRVVATPLDQSVRGFVGYDTFCSGQIEQDDHDYDTIRHVIAVHPVEMKIPFVLADIPIPTLQTPAN